MAGPRKAVGAPWAGRLVRGVKLPDEGPDWFTWDPVLTGRPTAAGAAAAPTRLVRTVLRVLREYRAANPGVPRVGIGDLSRPHGGHFGRAFGGLGHASHQNGRDVDVWYPRIDWLERRPARSWQVDRALAQELVDRFVAAGAREGVRRAAPATSGPREGRHPAGQPRRPPARTHRATGWGKARPRAPLRRRSSYSAAPGGAARRARPRRRRASAAADRHRRRRLGRHRRPLRHADRDRRAAQRRQRGRRRGRRRRRTRRRRALLDRHRRRRLHGHPHRQRRRPTIDGRETAPQAFRPNSFIDPATGQPLPVRRGGRRAASASACPARCGLAASARPATARKLAAQAAAAGDPLRRARASPSTRPSPADGGQPGRFARLHLHRGDSTCRAGAPAGRRPTLRNPDLAETYAALAKPAPDALLQRARSPRTSSTPSTAAGSAGCDPERPPGG